MLRPWEIVALVVTAGCATALFMLAVALAFCIPG